MRGFFEGMRENILHIFWAYIFWELKVCNAIQSKLVHSFNLDTIYESIMFNKKASKNVFCQIVDTHFLAVQGTHNFSCPDMITELVLNCVIFIILHHHKNVKNEASLLATKEFF